MTLKKPPKQWGLIWEAGGVMETRRGSRHYHIAKVTQEFMDYISTSSNYDQLVKQGITFQRGSRGSAGAVFFWQNPPSTISGSNEQLKPRRKKRTTAGSIRR